MIPYAKQSISAEDISAVVEVLKSDFITQGPVVPQFEKAVADYCGVEFSIATANATSALHLACMALEIGPGDRVWTSPNTFVASANCVLYCGAYIDFVDIDPRTYNLCPLELEQKLIEAEIKEQLPKAVIAVHFAGQSCEMKKIHELSLRYGFRVIEDASHAIGGNYLGDKIGNCQYSDMTVFSFHPVKIITSGEGGMLLTNIKQLAERAALLNNHGITRNQDIFVDKTRKVGYYEQQQLGYNYRMSDIHAALGLSQFSRLDYFIQKRRELAEYYQSKLDGLSILVPEQHQDCNSAWHLYVVRLKEKVHFAYRDTILDKLKERGIAGNIHYIPVHTQPYFQKVGFKWGDYPKSEKYYRSCITLPLYVDLGFEQIDYVVTSLKEIL